MRVQMIYIFNAKNLNDKRARFQQEFASHRDMYHSESITLIFFAFMYAMQATPTEHVIQDLEVVVLIRVQQGVTWETSGKLRVELLLTRHHHGESAGGGKDDAHDSGHASKKKTAAHNSALRRDAQPPTSTRTRLRFSSSRGLIFLHLSISSCSFFHLSLEFASTAGVVETVAFRH